RFGASISEVADLNGDGFRDLAVGAPLENNNQGSVYIYNGGSGLPETFSQRIEASQVSSGLQYFGHSLHGVMDMSGDKLPDLAVGSLGRVLVLRARPVIEVQTSMNFTPNIIKTDNSNCSDNRAFDLTVCFTLTDTTRDNLGTKSASITYNLVLDSVRTQFRAFFTAKERNLTGSVNITGPSRCMKHSMFIPECPEDSLNSIGNEVNFQFTGLPVSSAIGLKPILDPRSPTRLFFPLNFERNCGTDNKCTDHLKLSFNFSGARELQVGISPVLNLTVSIENAQEDSYNTAVTFTYPSGLSYRRVTLLQSDRRMTVRCEATPSDEGDATRMSSCSINRPIFKQGAQGVFVATFDVDTNSQLNRTMTISAEATSENTDSITNNSKYAKQIAVKFAINIQVRKVEESTNYVNFSVGRNDLKRFVKHCYEVENFGLREIPVTVTISIPVELGGKPVWSDRNTLQIPNCIASEEGPNPTVDFVEKLKKDQSLDCSVARCRVFTCQITKLETKKKVTFNVSGEVKSDWIEQTQQRTVILLSSASLRYDQNQFIHIFTQSEKSYTQTKALTRIELYEEYNYLPVVIGSSVGGLVLLALITAGLYKAGFFKRQYKEMMNEAAGDAGVPGQEGSLPTAPPPE
ncbi:integrin alpha-M-like, partial [Huso huso]